MSSANLISFEKPEKQKEYPMIPPMRRTKGLTHRGIAMKS
jgi:hypothetical protein